MKRWMALILTLVIALAMTGCGNSAEEQAPKAEATPEPTAEPTPVPLNVEKKDLFGLWIGTNGEEILIEDGTIRFYKIKQNSEDRVDADISIDGNVLSLGIGRSAVIDQNDDGHYTLEYRDGLYNKADSFPFTSIELGETVKTDTVEFTLSAFEYVHVLDAHSMNPSNGNSGLGGGADKVFAGITYDVTNLSKENLNPVWNIRFIVNYNNGYLFEEGDTGITYIVKAPYNSVKFLKNGKEAYYTLSPLEKEDYSAYIPCHALIETDESSSLVVTIILPSSEGTECYNFIVR